MTTQKPIDVGHSGHRPIQHLTPARGWLSDPVGLVFHEGTYHCFYQHNPASIDWGPMHWGHATSTDLITWTHAEVALTPDADGMIYSGSAVVDEDNTAGFGARRLIAYFTLHLDGVESQAFAVSMDDGRTWQRPVRGTVLGPRPDTPDFRDPRIFRWSDDQGSARWIMLLAVGRSIEVHRSVDLRTWEFCSAFAGSSASSETWETPDLLRLDVEGDGCSAWVLTIGVLTSGPGSATCERYFVGQFDGHAFVPSLEDQGSPVDFGPDFYAAQSWSHAPLPTWTGWMCNWAYARALPAAGWRGALALPRHLSLRRVAGRLRLRQTPVKSFEVPVGPLRLQIEEASKVLPLPSHADLRCDVSCDHGDSVHLRLMGVDTTSVGLRWDKRQSLLTLDLTSVRSESYGEDLPRVFDAPLLKTCGTLQLRVIVDGCTLEVFADDGLTVLTALLPQDWLLAGIAASSDAARAVLQLQVGGATPT